MGVMDLNTHKNWCYKHTRNVILINLRTLVLISV